uniref:GATOR2 complex protein WDR24 n=1 Tax=Timema monikensis TaxID=170555 RepID=A0A7R9HRZ5_9NEOP|nr:unnamed protein product [Timema monikensis]
MVYTLHFGKAHLRKTLKKTSPVKQYSTQGPISYYPDSHTRTPVRPHFAPTSSSVLTPEVASSSPHLLLSPTTQPPPTPISPLSPEGYHLHVLAIPQPAYVFSPISLPYPNPLDPRDRCLATNIASEHKGDGPEKKITRLAIGVEGGFDPESGKNKFEFEESYTVVILPNFITLPWPDSEFPEILKNMDDSSVSSTDQYVEEEIMHHLELADLSITDAIPGNELEQSALIVDDGISKQTEHETIDPDDPNWQPLSEEFKHKGNTEESKKKRKGQCNPNEWKAKRNKDLRENALGAADVELGESCVGDTLPTTHVCDWLQVGNSVCNSVKAVLEAQSAARLAELEALAGTWDGEARIITNNTESVRDVQFSPHQSYVFVAVSENGNVQLWDMRRPDRWTQQFTAHSGPVFTCDWHPAEPWLATASRDKTIKVWDLSVKPTLEYVVPTIASVGFIKWRPQRKFHIASCALVVDCGVNVWDVRRPYIPYAAFTEHKDVATGVAWRGDPHVFLSTSRDHTLYHHVFQDATRPADKANPQGIALSCRMDVSHAYRVHVNPSRTAKLAGKLCLKAYAIYFRKVPTHNEKFYHSSSLMHRFTTKNSREVHNIEECARRYIITGRPLPEMCDHNAAVAKDMGRNQISLLWSIVKTLYSTNYKSGEFGQQTPSGTASREDPGTLQEPLGAPTGDGDQCSLIGGGGDTPGAASAGEDDTETDETPEQHFNNGRLNLGGHFSSSGFVGPQGDFFFGDGELDPMGIEFDNCSDSLLGLNISNMPLEIDNMDWTLPTEAFPLRHEIQDRSPPPEQFPNHGSPDLNEQGNTTLT